MDLVTTASYAVGAIAAAIAVAWPIALVTHRRVVPTNMVHIVQRGRSTTSYGRSSQENGNIYYEWPSWLPYFGVKVTEFPESIFEVTLEKYETYDSVNVPFAVDISAFFRLSNSAEAAQRVANFSELREQLSRVVQGSVRRILAQHKLEDIMKMRGELGTAFTDEVTSQVKQWGVEPVKTLELMNLRDMGQSTVIADIKSVETARIRKDSRVAVANNDKAGEQAEIEARREVQMAEEDARRVVGTRQAEVEKEVGLAKEAAKQQVADANKTTTTAEMAVREIADTRAAEIAKKVQVTKAEADAQLVTLAADAAKKAAELEAAGIFAKGEAAAKSETLMLQAPVTAQLELAQGIGANEGYQKYLVSIEQVKADQQVGIEMARAIGNAKLSVIANGGGDGGGAILDGVKGLAGMFSTKTGTNMAGMATALAATEEGEALLKGLANSNLTAVAAGAAAGQVTQSPAVAAVTAAAMNTSRGGDGGEAPSGKKGHSR